MRNTLLDHRRLVPAILGALVALPAAALMLALSLTGPGPWTAFALIAPVVGALMGLLLGHGVRPAPAPYPSLRAVVAALLAIPVGASLIAILLNAPWWTTQPQAALVQTAMYALAGTLAYGWLVLPLTVPCAVVGAFVLQWLLARLGAANDPLAA